MRHVFESTRGCAARSRRRQAVLRAAIESLETRRLMSVVTVNSTADTDTRDANFTLREAIEYVDGTLAFSSMSTQEQGQIDQTTPLGTNDTIDFNISGTGLHTFYPATALPAITNAVKIDGFSQPGARAESLVFSPIYNIAIDGVYTDAAAGLTIAAKNVTIDGLMIYRFTGNTDGSGIDLITGSGNDTIQGNYLGTDGTRTLTNDDGVRIENGSSNNTIGGTDVADRNVISGNGNGIEISVPDGATVFPTGNLIEGNYIGTDATGQTAIANNVGVRTLHDNGTTIGGTTEGARNIISGNTSYGAQIDLAYQDIVEGNYVGTDVSGTKAIANKLDGVHLDEDNETTVGGTDAGAGNLLSGNTYDGLYLYDDFTTHIQGNYIGTDYTGTLALANQSHGIYSSYGQDTLVGDGSAPTAARNIISGNGGDGVDVYEGYLFDIVDNYIGTDVSGKNAIGNTLDGILFDTKSAECAVIGNVISANGANGVNITGISNSNYLESNYIGTDVTGEVALGNSMDGVLIQDGSWSNTVGGYLAGDTNLISGNGGAGVEISGANTAVNTGAGSNPNAPTSTSYNNYVVSDLIGTDLLGQTAIYNGAGVLIDQGAQNNTIGGTSVETRNIISGNDENVVIEDSLTSGNVVEGNYIGTDITGTQALVYPTRDLEGSFPESFDDGVYIGGGASNNTIGGTTAGARNIISANQSQGVQIDNEATGNTLEGNFIGTDVTGTKALTNADDGIDITDAGNNTIGGTALGAGNLISGNTQVSTYDGDVYGGNGILMEGPDSIGNVIVGNFIGTDVTGTLALGNGLAGIHILGTSSNNRIGGITPGAGNIIAFNTTAGIEVSSVGGPASSPLNIAIQRNSIFSNGGLGIDLDNIATYNTAVMGVTPNDPSDADAGPNGYQNFPVIASASSTSSSVTVQGTFNSTANTIFTLDFYATDSIDLSGNGEGKQWIGAIGVLTDSNGNAVFNGTFNSSIGSNKFISATATTATSAPNGSTSEFSQSLKATDGTPVTPPTPPSVAINDVSANEGNSGTTALTFTVTRSGDLSGTSTVNYATSNGSATADSDYTANSGTISFAANQATATITVLVNGDTAVESNETFNVNLSSPTNATISDGSGLGTIVNDDVTPPPVAPSLAINDVSKNEGNSGTTVFTFTVTRTGDLTGTSTVNYATSNGSATAGSDYTAGSGTLTFIAGQATATITVLVNGDTAVESNETFNVNLSSPTNATISDGLGVGTIVNDDTTPPPTAPSVSINDVSKNEGNSGTTAFTFTLTRTGDLSKTSAVTISTANGTATAGSDYTALSGIQVSFAANQATATVTVNVTGDTTVESNETFMVNVAAFSNVTISDGQGIGTIVNDDTTPPPAATQFKGTAFGTAGSYQNMGSTIAKAFDGDLTTYFDGPSANGNIVGVDLGSAKTITQIKYAPRSGWAARMVGGVFQASNSANFSSFVTLATVSTTPTVGVLTTVNISNTTAYRYFRYVAPNGSYGNIAEFQLFGTSGTTTTPPVTTPTPTKLIGTTIGTSGSFQNSGSTIAKATDGNLTTFFDGPSANGNWVGLDLGTAKVIKQISYAPRSNFASRMVGGYFQASNSADFSNAVTLFTIAAAPPEGMLTTVSISNTTAYRFVRYVSPNGSYGNVSEINFYG